MSTEVKEVEKEVPAKLPEETGEIKFQGEESSETENKQALEQLKTEEGPLIGKGQFKRFRSDEAELDANNISFSEFRKRRGLVPKPEEKAETKVEEKVEPKPSPVQRDLTGIAEEDAPLFRQMSNEAFNKLKPIYLKQREAENQLVEYQKQLEEAKNNPQVPPHYFTHPRGFMLQDEYLAAVGDASKAQQIVDHWNRQMIKIRQGEKWQPLEENEKGDLVFGEERDADAEGEVFVNRQILFSQNQLTNVRNDLNGIITGFSSKSNDAINWVKNVENQFFPDYDKPEHPTAQLQKSLLDQIHPAFKSDPLAKILIKTGAANTLLQARIKQLEDELKTAKSLKNDMSKAQPPSSNFVSRPTNTAPTISISEFKSRLGR